MSQSDSNCKDNKCFREHLAAVLPFQVIEKMADKPLRIRGVAMIAGMSRNFNIYTAAELEAFSAKLAGAPVYVEHVSAELAVGKVTAAEWDGRALWYEAEIFESEIADKIRKGLIQHVSVGADYEAIDLVDGKVPHGLHNAELSLVAVPGIPETNITVLESLNQNANELKTLREQLSQAEHNFSEAQKTITELKASKSLILDPPKSMPIAEAVLILEGLIPVAMVERSSLGMQRECQAIRAAIYELKERLV